MEILAVKQFKDRLDDQINFNIIGALKDEEWLLENVGLGTLNTNNLLPEVDAPLRVKDVYEAFLRFDDKPMIVGKDAITRSLQRYCTRGEFAIGSGDGKDFTRIYYKESVPFLDVDDDSLWLVDKSKAFVKQEPASFSNTSIGSTVSGTASRDEFSSLMVSDQGDEQDVSHETKRFRILTVSGSLPSIEKYTDLFNYFIGPFLMNGNKVEIDVKFRIKSTEVNPLVENMPQYKSAKEAAKQLGLDFEEEEM